MSVFDALGVLQECLEEVCGGDEEAGAAVEESALEDEVFEKLQAAVGESAQDAFAVANFCGA